jgi:hypothetical protein
LYYRQRLDSAARSYDRPSVERRLSARQVEAQLRREEQEEKAREAQHELDVEWDEYQKMLFFWKPLPEIPSLEDFRRAQAKRPFETELEPPRQLDWTEEEGKCVGRLTVSLKSQLPYKLLPAFIAKWKAKELIRTLWPEQQKEIQQHYDEAVTAYEEQLKAAEGQWDVKENERIAWLQRLSSGDMTEVKHTVDEIFTGLALPFKSQTHCAVFFDAADAISVNIELPEMEEIIPFTRKRLLKNGETRESARDKVERNRDYFEVVTGEIAFVAAEVFSYLPLCLSIRIAAYTHRPKEVETDPIDTYILDVHYTRDELKAYNPDTTAMLSFLTRFGARFKVAGDFKLERIDPPSWLSHADVQNAAGD